MKIFFVILIFSMFSSCSLSEGTDDLTLEQLKTVAAAQSKYLSMTSRTPTSGTLEADLEGFEAEIEPILVNTCLECHGPEKSRARFRIDTLDPDLVHGKDTDWWLEVIYVLSNGEMPPPDKGVELADQDRGQVIDWLSEQVLIASQVERGEAENSV